MNGIISILQPISFGVIMSQKFNISDIIDVSFPLGNKYANIHLFTGDIVHISKEVIDRMHNTMQPLQQPKPISFEEAARAVIQMQPIYNNDWPNGTENSPVWKTSDNRVIPLVEMSEYHIANAQRIVANIIRQYPYTKNIAHYKQWRNWFDQEVRRRKHG